MPTFWSGSGSGSVPAGISTTTSQLSQASYFLPSDPSQYVLLQFVIVAPKAKGGLRKAKVEVGPSAAYNHQLRTSPLVYDLRPFPLGSMSCANCKESSSVLSTTIIEKRYRPIITEMISMMYP